MSTYPTTYETYVNKNYETLAKEYEFFGGTINTDTHILIEGYEKEEKYDCIVLKKV